MIIKETCCCGATFYVKDHVVFNNTAKDRYNDFLNAHKICREADSMRNKKIKITTESKICKCGHQYSHHVNPKTLKEDGCVFSYNCGCEKFTPEP